MDEAGILQTYATPSSRQLSDSLPIMTTWGYIIHFFFTTGTELARTRPGHFLNTREK